MNTLKNKKGFTLVELLVVISIISLLTSVILASLNDAKKKSADAARVRSMTELRSALQMYHSDKGYYPSGLTLSSDLVNYIKTINTEIVYNGTMGIDGSGAPCNTSGPTCVGYHMGIKLEKSGNTVLNSDKDIETNGVVPDGLSSVASCGIDSSITALINPNNDLCYDLAQ